MGKKGPKRGSRAYWHRKRASSIVPRVRTWNRSKGGLCGFAGYKVGMMQVRFIDDSARPTAGQEIIFPATVLEVPPLYLYSVTAYARDVYGLHPVLTVTSTSAPKHTNRLTPIAKKSTHSLDELKQKLSEFAELRVLAFTQPAKSGLGKKTPEALEIALGGKLEDQLAFASEHLGKELQASKVFTAGEYIDAISVTTGRGWQGVVKRFGVALGNHKSTGARRHGGSIGGERQGKVMYTIPRAGQMGFHNRVDEHKRVLMLSDAKTTPAFNPPQGFKRYGVVKSDFIVLAGSVPGPSKRLIRLRKSLRPPASKEAPAITFQSLA